MTTNITVSRDYLLSLFRRLELGGVHLNGQSIPEAYNSGQAVHDDESTITIPVSEYKELKTAAQEYRTLTKALVTAGTSLESIKVLAGSSQQPSSVKDEPSKLNKIRPEPKSPAPSKYHEDSDVVSGKCRIQNGDTHQRFYTQDHPLPTPSPSSEEMLCSEDTDDMDASQESIEFPDTHNDRSLIIRGLPKSARLSDITKIIHGGMILNLFMRRQRGTAHVAFVEPSAAQRFLIYASHNEIVIKGKVVTVAWDEKQYYMLGAVARRVYQDGATRNLVIHFPRPEITEKTVREDLEHIHTLEVVDLQFRNGHVWISLNSIKHALTAKSCMSSRLRYKGYRIDFWPDDCATLPTTRTLQPPQPKQYTQTLKSTAKIFSNRFLMLDDENGGSNSDSSSET